jgi:methylenetetrahydrofolate dehydrogenase (NADP+)/methenyltetrahydrofolate cyclohydrolase
MAQILSGGTKAQNILKNLKQQAKKKNQKLVVVQVGENKVSARYIAEKEKAAAYIGIGVSHVQLKSSISQKKLESEIENIAKKKKNTAIIIQLPLPKKFDVQAVLNCIPPEKDVDLLSEAGFGAFVLGKSPILPPTVAAIATLLKSQNLKGKKVVVVGAGRLVGVPVSVWLLQQGAAVSVIDRTTKDKTVLLKQADIIISGVGKKNVIKGSQIKRGSIVIDAGTSVEGSQTTGDIEFTSVVAKAKAVTPVPGGVGPLTVAHLFRNTVILGS